MISVNEARQIISKSVKALPPTKILLKDAWDTVLAEDVFAPFDIPAYRQSSMDGYAFSFNDLKKQNEFSVVGESAAGNTKELSISNGSAARIFTGAAVPDGADTVVMQEKTAVIGNRVTVLDDTLEAGSNVRAKGSEISRGALALSKGTYLGAAATGFLANIGITHVNVYPKPRTAVILTGNELKDPGEPLNYGEVYESNSFALCAATRQFHLPAPTILKAKDDPDTLKQTFEIALSQSNLILLTGGVSVGDYDFVRGTAENCGVTTLFHRIKQRPGKPLYFGMLGEKVIFGLPGNPSSVLTCFYEYVVPAIAKMTNGQQRVTTLQAPLSEGFIKKVRFTQFLKGYYNGKSVLPLSGQESYKMNSFAKANCLIVLNEEDEECKPGDVKEVHLIN